MVDKKISGIHSFAESSPVNSARITTRFCRFLTLREHFFVLLRFIYSSRFDFFEICFWHHFLALERSKLHFVALIGSHREMLCKPVFSWICYRFAADLQLFDRSDKVFPAKLPEILQNCQRSCKTPRDPPCITLSDLSEKAGTQDLGHV